MITWANQSCWWMPCARMRKRQSCNKSLLPVKSLLILSLFSPSLYTWPNPVSYSRRWPAILGKERSRDVWQHNVHAAITTIYTQALYVSCFWTNACNYAWAWQLVKMLPDIITRPNIWRVRIAFVPGRYDSTVNLATLNCGRVAEALGCNQKALK